MLLCTIFQGDTEYNGQTYKSNIGYFVLEAFDDMAFSEVKQAIDFLAENQIDDLILDLRFSPGGSVALCRYLMTAITKSAVPSVDGSVFKKLPMKKEFGRYGNFIYSDEVITIDAE